MALNRMRTINEVLRIIQEADPESAIIANCIRSLCKNGTVRIVRTAGDGRRPSRPRANQHHNRHIQPLPKKFGQNSSGKD